MVFGEEGIFAITFSGAVVQMADEPTGSSFALADLLVSQGAAPGQVFPLWPQGPILIRHSGGERRIEPEGGEEIRLFDVAAVDGRLVAVVTARSGSDLHTTDERLLLVDLETLQRSDLGSVGGWEEGVSAARHGEGLIVVLRSALVDHSLEAWRPDGTRAWSIGPVGEPEASLSLVVAEGEVLLLHPQLDEELTGVLGVTRYRLEDGEVLGHEKLTLQSSFQGGFCQWADWDGEALACGQSYGGPVRIDPHIGEVSPLSSLSSGNPSVVRVVGPPSDH